jgi:hypothetical protein
MFVSELSLQQKFSNIGRSHDRLRDNQRGEPKKIPNTPALPQIAKLHREGEWTAGPFIVLAEVSDPGSTPDILSIRVWRLSAQHLSAAKRVPVEELGTSIFTWRI